MYGAAGTASGVGFDSFAGASSVGNVAEAKTAAALNALASAPGGPTVLHDLDIPNALANIDHVVVSGSRVFLVDSKRWKPGFYWTIFGATYRGLTRVPHADKKTLPFAAARLKTHLGTDVRRSVLAIWPSSSTKTLSLWAYRPKEAVAVHGDSLGSRLALMGATKPADPKVVQRLLPYVRS